MTLSDRVECRERYVLLPVVKGSGWMIRRLVPDADFDPPLWVEREMYGPFKSRETARQFMVRRTANA